MVKFFIIFSQKHRQFIKLKFVDLCFRLTQSQSLPCRSREGGLTQSGKTERIPPHPRSWFCIGINFALHACPLRRFAPALPEGEPRFDSKISICPSLSPAPDPTRSPTAGGCRRLQSARPRLPVHSAGHKSSPSSRLSRRQRRFFPPRRAG